MGIYVWSSTGQWDRHQYGTTSIANGTITTDLLAADAVTANMLKGLVLESSNYKWGSQYAEEGMCIDLANGSIRSVNFSTDSGWTYIRGEINVSSAVLGVFQSNDRDFWNGIGQGNTNSCGMNMYGDVWAQDLDVANAVDIGGDVNIDGDVTIGGTNYGLLEVYEISANAINVWGDIVVQGDISYTGSCSQI